MGNGWTCYQKLGTDEVMCASENDICTEFDCLKESGAVPPPPPGRYAATACGSVTDAASGLEWYVGPDVTMSWEDAKSWATRQLGACGTGWRLPTTRELKALYDPSQTAGTGFSRGGKRWPARMDPVFDGIGGGSWIWTGEAAGQGKAYSVNMNQGVRVPSPRSPDYPVRAFAVRRASR